jgi:pyrroline-5-carboxylate reductase
MAIGFLGAGKMAEALLSSLVLDELCEPWEIIVCDISKERRDRMAEQYEVAVTDDAAEVVEECDVLVVAVKPQDVDALLAGVKDQLNEEHLVISIAAGKTLAALQGVIGTKPRLVRVMPNLALSVGEGMSVFCAAENVTEDDKDAAMELFGAAGAVLELPEQNFDAVTALSGSGPAFVAYVLQAMIKAAVALGLPEEDARLLAEQTLIGTAVHLQTTGDDIGEFIQAVASPKGTTAAGLAVLEASDVSAVIDQTLAAAAVRSRELSKA